MVSYGDVCFGATSSSSTSACMDLPVEERQTGTGETDVIVTLLIRDDTLGRSYLDALRGVQHVTLGVDAESSIGLSMLPLPYSASSLGQERESGVYEEERQGGGVFSLYPYSSLSIFTRTNSDVFTPSQRRAYRQQQQQQQQHHAHLPFPSSSTLKAAQDTAGVPTSITTPTETNPARHIRFLAYALRALVTRFWMLAKNADSADIFVVLLGYVLMHFTFVRLFLNMRKMGSSFWLRESRRWGVSVGQTEKGRKLMANIVDEDSLGDVDLVHFWVPPRHFLSLPA